jgi:hypothetical protein
MKIVIDGAEFEIDLDKAKELGVIKKTFSKLEPKRFEGGVYYYATGVNGAQECKDTNRGSDDTLHEICNYFKSKEQAKLMAEATYNLWYKIRAWAIREGVLESFESDNCNYYLYYDSDDDYWSVSHSYNTDHGRVYLTMEGAVKLAEILNEGKYRP